VYMGRRCDVPNSTLPRSEQDAREPKLTYMLPPLNRRRSKGVSRILDAIRKGRDLASVLDDISEIDRQPAVTLEGSSLGPAGRRIMANWTILLAPAERRQIFEEALRLISENPPRQRDAKGRHPRKRRRTSAS
jgi:hypothetical protein